MTEYNTLLTRAANHLTDHGYVQTASVHDRVEKGKGVTYLAFKGFENRFLVRAKDYVYHRKAPFGVEMVEQAIEHDAILIIYFGKEAEFFVFHPRHIEAEGTLETERSKRSKSREWLEVDLDDGVTLEEYERGVMPAIPEKYDSGDNRVLGDYFTDQ